MINIKNVGEVCDTIDKWIADVEKLTTKFCRGVTVQLFEQILINSVQFSGDFAGNWKYELNGVTPEFTPGIAFDELKKTQVVWTHGAEKFFTAFAGIDSGVGGASQAPALQYAVRNARGKDDKFKLGDTAYIHNSAQHDDAYAVMIENGTLRLKVPDNAHPVERALKSVLGHIAGGAQLTNERLVDAAGLKSATKKTQLDSLRRRQYSNSSRLQG